MTSTNNKPTSLNANSNQVSDPSSSEKKVAQSVAQSGALSPEQNENFDILKEFQDESKGLISQLIEILEECEGNFSQVKRLEEYGQTVDRIMGGAKSLAIALNEPDGFVAKIGDYSALCKAVGYKASQIKGNAPFFEICVALLFDATDVLKDLVDSLFLSKAQFAEAFSNTFLDRLKWISAQFGSEYRASVEVKKEESSSKLKQDEIDDLLRKLGLI